MTPAQYNELQRQADVIEQNQRRLENLTPVEWLIEQCPRIQTIASAEVIEQAKLRQEQYTIAFADRFAKDYIGFSRVSSDINADTAAQEYYNRVVKNL